MKTRYLLGFVLVLTAGAARAQSVGIGTAAPNAAAALDISATGKGLLIPRLSQAQRTAIAAPPDGLMVFQTDGSAGFWYAFGGSWVNIPNANTAVQPANGLSGTGPAVKLGGDLSEPTTVVQNGNALSVNTFASVGSGPGNASSNQTVVIGAGGKWQSFTASATARLVGVDVDLFTQTGGPFAGVLTLYAGTGTGGAVLGTAAIGQTTQGATETRSAAFGSPPALLAGQVYTIGLANPGSAATSWRIAFNTDPYAGGQSSLAADADFVFGTQLGTGSAPALAVAGSGQVGVGTATPTAALDVAGSTRLRGLTTAGVVTTDASGNLGSTLASALGDDLGNHTATQALNLQANTLTGTGSSIGGVGLGVRADGGLNLGQNTAGRNIFLGYQAGQSNISGSQNQFSGYQSGFSNTTGILNLFSGYGSGFSNTTGDSNYFSGFQSGYRNTTADNNQFSGYQSGYNNTTGENNHFSGYLSGFRNTTGFTNQFIGYASGYNNTTGSYNDFSGYFSGYRNTTGENNQFSGRVSGYSNTTGSTNQFNGYASGVDNTTGSYNDFSGYISGFRNTTGSTNQFSGNRSGYGNTTGSGNQFVGYESGLYNTIGSNNWAFGYQAGPAPGSVNLTNAGAIGYQATVSQSNALALGGLGANAVNVGIGTATPDRPLTVVGTGAASQLISLKDNAGITQWHLNLATAGSPGLNLAESLVADYRLFVQNGGNVGIGTGSPSVRLDVNGSARLRGLTTAGIVTTDASGNLSSAPASVLNGDDLGNHTATQALNLQANTLTGTGSSISGVGLGVRADGGLNLGQNTAGRNIFLGYQAGQSNAGNLNQFSGYQSGLLNATGSENHFDGYQSGFSNRAGNRNQFSGYQSGYRNITGSGNQFNGYTSGFYNTTGSFNQFNGYGSGLNNTTGNGNQFSGYESGLQNTTGDNNWAFGYQAGPTTGNLTNAGAIGYLAQVSRSNALALGGLGANAVNVGIGTADPDRQ